MSKILILSCFYSPAYKGGGPIKSISGLSKVLSKKSEVYVFCLNCDIDGSFLDIPVSNKWIDVDGVKVFYSSKDKLIINLLSIMRSKYDYLYLNSFFSFYYSIVPIILISFFKTVKNIILAPRGELSPGALTLKSKKKIQFLILCKWLNIYKKNMTWHATSVLESNEIRDTLKKYLDIDNPVIKIAQNISPISEAYRINVIEKKQIDLVFLSRISPKKNLEYALKVLEKCNLFINFDIWGPLEDPQYWAECEKLIGSLPSNIKVTYKGSIGPSEVPGMLSKYDLFFFPTLGENYGHVIAESLSVGTPLLISNTTPWINLDYHGIGKDIDLNNMMEFVDYLEDFNCKNIQERTLMRENALKYFSEKFCGKNIVAATYDLFKSKV